MPEKKTEQTNMSFTPQILSELESLCKINLRSRQNMVEVLIHQEYERTLSLAETSGTANRGE